MEMREENIGKENATQILKTGEREKQSRENRREENSPKGLEGTETERIESKGDEGNDAYKR